ncbi:MAG: hypothetical protein EOS25_26395 [Mesorhizobium sp.]|uniref:hypothetical protein n=1 Tax=Mesorhizobium sp. TaxID=1871066 RepID=UPI000FE5A72B|nr:hypothetical protein [Mesorhizobium sp.]RWD50573.1 MAG: hypothetical protein EOS59_09255 [Mesorhizobium sp.]RWE55788.1 MAG: hypothetical protein EOS24_23240 [Mesorhizobium sp.]RWF09693.1 MAG: hypothetical protein EOS69_17235 [Mesorhizobium sp.]RWF14651.1 MAG: hypothetical protein EOS25_26395 [Mesorhizobium sp.]TIX86035.1 MAG: hypothetical protein E5V21_02355 [Mesorhizobium sp.]
MENSKNRRRRIYLKGNDHIRLAIYKNRLLGVKGFDYDWSTYAFMERGIYPMLLAPAPKPGKASRVRPLNPEEYQRLRDSFLAAAINLEGKEVIEARLAETHQGI